MFMPYLEVEDYWEASYWKRKALWEVLEEVSGVWEQVEGTWGEEEENALRGNGILFVI